MSKAMCVNDTLNHVSLVAKGEGYNISDIYHNNGRDLKQTAQAIAELVTESSGDIYVSAELINDSKGGSRDIHEVQLSPTVGADKAVIVTNTGKIKLLLLGWQNSDNSGKRYDVILHPKSHNGTVAHIRKVY